MLNLGIRGIYLDSINPGHVAYGAEGVREHSLEGNYVPGCCSGSVSCLSQAWVGAGVLRADVSQLPLDGVGLWDIVVSRGSWNVMFFTVFLMHWMG